MANACAVMNAQFLQDVLDMGRDGRWADHELLRDLGCAAAP